MAFQDLVARVDSMGLGPFAGSVYRHTTPGLDPRSGVGARIHGGRWNPPDSFSTLYLGLSRGTVAAEWKRAAAKQNLSLEDFLPRNLHTLAVSLSGALDLRDVGALEAIGLAVTDIRGDDSTACQRVGEAAHYSGVEAILAPSATGQGEVLALFVDRMLPGSSIDVVTTERWVVPEDVV